MWGAYGVLHGFSLGGSAPQTPHQGSSATLDTTKYGLVTPQYWRLPAGWPSYAPGWPNYAPPKGIMCRPLKKRPKS